MFINSIHVFIVPVDISGWSTAVVVFLHFPSMGIVISGLELVVSTLTGLLSCHTVATKFEFGSWKDLCSPCTIQGGFLTSAGRPFLLDLTVPFE